ncbi:uncharacterized protein LOC117653194 [Thrips palmi]|uniref:Uncharacterized protein LOC117653194 n=1 Tax=Thrips palmi TaxID=161013 RepID=A0A6P9AAS8_THRPL|nr:uncharacterized protein LOC117653194 [Thrips palmi]
MSRKSSKSSSEREFEVCAVSATSTPNKDSSRRFQTVETSLRSFACSPSSAGGGGGSPRLSPVSPATPSSARNVQFYTARQDQRERRRPSAGSTGSGGARRGGRANANVSRKLFGDLSEYDDLGLGSAEGAWTHDSVARLLREEAEDIRLASLLGRSTAGGGLDASFGPPGPRFPLTEPVRHAQKDMRAMPVGENVLYHGEGEEPGSLTPAEVAAMMHRLEHGVSMDAPPEQLFKFLFPNVSKTKARLYAQGSEQGAEQAASKGLSRNDNTLHKAEPCPIVCFGGGYPGDLLKAQTLVQLRGDAPPPWFPGYFMALPQTGGAVRVMQSPAQVLQAAYRAAEPANVPPESRFVY